MLHHTFKIWGIGCTVGDRRLKQAGEQRRRCKSLKKNAYSTLNYKRLGDLLKQPSTVPFRKCYSNRSRLGHLLETIFRCRLIHIRALVRISSSRAVYVWLKINDRAHVHSKIQIWGTAEKAYLYCIYEYIQFLLSLTIIAHFMVGYGLFMGFFDYMKNTEQILLYIIFIFILELAMWEHVCSISFIKKFSLLKFLCLN